MKWNSFWPPEPIISSWSPEIKQFIRNHKTEGTGRNDPIMVFCQVYDVKLSPAVATIFNFISEQKT